MAIPNTNEILLPFLKSIANGKIYSTHNIRDLLTKYFQLTDEEANQLKLSGTESLFFNRLRWAKLYLKRAELLSDSKSSHVKITKEGKKLLEQKPDKISPEYLKKNYPTFKEWAKKSKKSSVSKRNN